MKGYIKSITTDKYLFPIRKQMRELIEPNSTVIDFGCGTGDFLLNLSDKIDYGLGIDQSEALINYAKRNKRDRNLKNINYVAQKATPGLYQEQQFNHATASLFFHVLPFQESISLLNYMVEISRNTLVCGFCKPKTRKDAILLWFDQRVTSHFKHYKTYQQNGYMEGLIQRSNYKIELAIDTFDPTIKIYKIKT